MRFIFLLTILLCSGPTFAGQQLPPPQDLVKQAEQGRIQLREVVFMIEKYIPEFTTLDDLNKYMRILPELQILSDKFKLDEIYPRAIPRIGEYMFSAAIKWLDVRFLPQEQLLFFARFANFDLAFRFSDSIESMLRPENNQSILMTATNNIEALRLQFIQTLPNSPGLDSNFRRILSDLAVKYISQPSGLTEEQIDFWIGKLSNSSGFSSAMDWLNNKIVVLKDKNKLDSHVYMSRLVTLQKRMLLFADELGTSIFSSLSDTVAELLFRMMTLSVTFNEGEFENALTLLMPRSVRTLTQNLMGQQAAPPADYIQEYSRVARLIIAKLEELGFEQDVRDFTAYVQRILLPANAALFNIEGQYSVVEPNGKRWQFTIIQARKNVYFAAIGNEEHTTFKSYLNLTSDFVNGGFLASEREPDNSAIHNFTARFDIDDKGNIQIQDFQSFSTLRTFSGRKTSELPVYKMTPGQALITSGRFAGQIEYLDGDIINCTLDITVFPGYILGRLNIYYPNGKIKAFVDYGIGGKVIDNTYSLTTGQMFSLNWNHLRGALINDELRGVMIVGGKGVMTKEFVFKKINNESRRLTQ